MSAGRPQTSARPGGSSRPRHTSRALALPALLVLVGLATSACSPFAPSTRTSPAGELPALYSLYDPAAEAPERWWKTLGDSQLDSLIDQALTRGFTLTEAWARLSQVRARTLQTAAALYPEVSGAAEAAFSRQHTEEIGTRGGEFYSLGLISAYELDLWGRVRSESEAARLAESATREDLNAAAMTVAAEVAQRWAQIISQRLQKRLLERQLETNETFLELIELRFRKAITSALDFYQQKQVVEGVRAQIPLVEAEEALRRHELAILLGKPPRTALTIDRKDLPLPADVPPTGLPADLLAARPDVRAAGLRLEVADWQVAAARANRLPALRLTAEANYQANRFDALFDNWLANLANNLTAPLFDAGRRRAQVDEARAAAAESLSVYRRTVLTAIREVEDALVREAKQRENLDALAAQIDAARRALDEAGNRYLNGLSDYLPVLTQVLAVQSLERTVIQRRTELLLERISLYRALGGHWTDRLAPPPQNTLERETPWKNG
jgi:NodT family efflux transporter outer membrane factor (OMF) lipoprotein